MSWRAQLLLAVQTCLRRITQADGYSTDIGELVTLEPAPAVGEDCNEFVAVVWSRQARPSDPALVRTHRLTELQIIAKVPATLHDAQARVDAITDDIERAMAERYADFPQRIQFPVYQSAEPFSGPITASWVGVTFTYTSHIPIK